MTKTIIEKEDKYRSAVLKIMALSETDILNILKKYVTRIISASVPYKSKDFTFSKIKSLNNKIDNIIKSINIEILSISSKREEAASKVACDRLGTSYDENIVNSFDNEEIQGSTYEERVKYYLSNFKKEMEAFIAIGFALEYSNLQIYNTWMVNRKNPLGSILFKKFFMKMSASYLNGKTKFGKGFASSSFVGLKTMEMDNTFQSYNYTQNSIWKDDKGIEGWYTVRGSNYPCPECDSHVGEFHDKKEIFYGYHPRCCCIMIPLKIEK